MKPLVKAYIVLLIRNGNGLLLEIYGYFFISELIYCQCYNVHTQTCNFAVMKVKVV